MSKFAGLVFLTSATAGYLYINKWGFWPSDVDAGNVPELQRVPTRQQQISKLKSASVNHPFDVLIVGGGATGSGSALDAATRGLRTVLVEREDFASGTSSRSTKLVHGGVRYLEKAVFNLDYSQLKLVREALAERFTLLQNAPHLAAALPILTPCYKWWEVPYYWLGLKAYDFVAGSRNLALSRYVPRGEATRCFPLLAEQGPDGENLKGAILYYDGQFDDSRLNVTLACSAAAAGAITLNYTNCKSLIKNDEGKVVGALVQDMLTGEQTEVYAKVVINATGPFADSLRLQAEPDAPRMIQASSGTHITVPGYFGGSDVGMIIPKTKDGRVVFMLPWHDHMIVGTTDNKCEVTDRPQPREDEIGFILDTVNDHLSIKLLRSDVSSAWCGIRPLVGGDPAKASQSVVRDHVVIEEPNGLITITGGKWTTYRKMAQDVVDVAIATGRLPLNTGGCVTQTLPLLGAKEYKKSLVAEIARTRSSDLHIDTKPSTSASSISTTLPPDVVSHLVGSYGDRAPSVLALATQTGLWGRLATGHPFLEAEVLYCCRNEYCETVSDFIARRCRIAFLDADAASASLPRVSALMATEKGWSAAEANAQLAAGQKYLSTFYGK